MDTKKQYVSKIRIIAIYLKNHNDIEFSKWYDENVLYNIILPYFTITFPRNKMFFKYVINFF